MTKKEIINAILSADTCEYDRFDLAARVDGGHALSAGQVRWLDRLIPGGIDLLADNPATQDAIAQYRKAELRLLISRTGLKKEKIAQIAQVTTVTISNMLAGKSKVPAMLIAKLRAIDKLING